MENSKLKSDNASLQAEFKAFKQEFYTKETKAYWICELACINWPNLGDSLQSLLFHHRLLMWMKSDRATYPIEKFFARWSLACS
ncbi:hypothetical protein SMACR_07695 [Sordaria macrospora]|uniref:WGS project CABT00000000 data, contig 2.27 n=2 Tax=Sordaria macrospora TaxID=5147 RepID=F7W4F5_SORMK|nr:uncharacterized protein SMAC_07695 [Sordaria macrospora k-hell]KAA8634882.1 hypothetical protein SMACR_07695 [Sordaria macrospora]WPJ67407.1 hypothetical protein SMAC4_07695 [Sordaria macrospora]CCC14908.1 unnamed protein product [Sordaria macrospora k-hell]